MPQPLKIATLLYMAGLALGRLRGIDPAAGQIILASLCLLSLFLLFSRHRTFPLVILLLFLPLGLLAGRPPLMDRGGIVPPAERRVIEGTVSSREASRGGIRFVISEARIIDEGEASPLPGALLLTLAAGGEGIAAGDRVRFMGRIRQPRNFGNPGGFDYEGWLRDRGIWGTVRLEDDRFVAALGDGDPIRRGLHRLRQEVGAVIAGSRGGEAARGILAALALGDRHLIDEETTEAFRRTGVAHLLAISGLHMGIVAFFFYRLFRWLLARSERLLVRNRAAKGAALLTFAPLTLYLFASGMAVSAVRAYLMVAVFLLSVLLGRAGEIYNTLAAAALLILFVWPAALFDVSFQLSFAAVLAIVLLVPPLEAAFIGSGEGALHGLRRRCLTFLFVTLAASLGTAPIVTRAFMEVSLIGLAANLLIVPLVAFVTVPPATLALFAAPLAPQFAGLLFSAAALPLAPALALTEAMAGLPFASRLTPPPSALAIVAFYGLLLAASRLKGKGLALGLLLPPLIFGTLGEVGRGEGKGRLEVTFLSVGQGESTFIRFPGGETMLVDGGGFHDRSFDMGRMVIRPYLLAQGVRRLDYVVLTHPHPDHMNGLLSIVSDLPVAEFWTTADPGAAPLRELAAGLSVRGMIIDDRSPARSISGVKVLFLNPPQGYAGGESDPAVNNGSLVIQLTYKERSFLLAADMEAPMERRLLHAGALLHADVLKVPHHGSTTGSIPAFVEAVSPRYALFTAGYGNRFGFPKEEVVARYEAAGSKIYRTDLDGAVTFTTDGKDLAVETYYPRPPMGPGGAPQTF